MANFFHIAVVTRLYASEAAVAAIGSFRKLGRRHSFLDGSRISLSIFGPTAFSGVLIEKTPAPNIDPAQG